MNGTRHKPLRDACCVARAVEALESQANPHDYPWHEVFWRVHWPGSREFTQGNAWSRPWSDDDAAPQVGYSCARSAEDLLTYFTRRNMPNSEVRVVIFLGTERGSGPDNEPLVMPSREARDHVWTTVKTLIAYVQMCT